MSADNLMKPAYCPSCGAPVEGAQPGQMHTCNRCGQTARMVADPPAPQIDSFVSITANTVKAKRIVGRDLVETHYHADAAPTAPESTAVDSTIAAAVLCPHCSSQINSGQKGLKCTCPLCGGKCRWKDVNDDGIYVLVVDGPRPTVAKTGSGDVVGDGRGVTISGAEGDVEIPGDVTGRYKVGDD